MNDEKLKAVMEMFAGLNHGEQVDLFDAIRKGLLSQRAGRIETHQKEVEYNAENIKALNAGNAMIAGSLPMVGA